jgi:DNA-binding MarR family transcriptional regulator
LFEPSVVEFRSGITAGISVREHNPEQPHCPPHAQIKRVRTAIRARSSRTDFFNARLFSDPAWDILLELYLSELLQRRISVSALGGSGGIAPTTVLRWLDILRTNGLIERTDDPLDARRVFVSLSPKASKAMHDYFAALGEPLVIR